MVTMKRNIKKAEVMKTIVISAVNLIEAGTLTILKDCLSYLSSLAKTGDYRIVALVYDKKLADYPNIEYIETQWPKKRWVNRLWFEYVSARKISTQLGPVYLWFSLHDTTTNVVAQRRAVYCHNPFPFYKWKWREWFLTPKIVMFALFSKFIYKKNITKNNYVVVQQEWIRKAFLQMFPLQSKQIIVALPNTPSTEELKDLSYQEEDYNFVYAASPNSHKNFECLCQAGEILEEKYGLSNFKIHVTVAGGENRYAKWLHERWGNTVKALSFIGFQNRRSLFSYYALSDCLVFPSKVETWGLPISEFASFQKPMLLADLPYTYETAAGSSKVAFFNPDSPEQLAGLMKRLIQGDETFLKPVYKKALEQPISHNWEEMFRILLEKK